jgi:hypothetical protein
MYLGAIMFAGLFGPAISFPAGSSNPSKTMLRFVADEPTGEIREASFRTLIVQLPTRPSRWSLDDGRFVGDGSKNRTVLRSLRTGRRLQLIADRSNTHDSGAWVVRSKSIAWLRFVLILSWPGLSKVGCTSFCSQPRQSLSRRSPLQFVVNPTTSTTYHSPAVLKLKANHWRGLRLMEWQSRDVFSPTVARKADVHDSCLNIIEGSVSSSMLQTECLEVPHLAHSIEQL